MINELLNEITNICAQPGFRSDKERKKSIYRQCKERCKFYMDKATEERKKQHPFELYDKPSNAEIMIHMLQHTIVWSDFTAAMSSDEYADYILTAVAMAAKSEAKHNGNTNN